MNENRPTTSYGTQQDLPESHPLLSFSKANGTNRRPPSWIKLLLTLAAIVFLAISLVAVKWQNTSNFASNHDHENGSFTRDEASSDQWWINSKVQKTHTYLPGLLVHVDPQQQYSKHRKLRWGIIGLGRIAQDFSAALIMTGANITAVAAESLPNATLRAQAFAELHGVPKSYGSYSELAKDPNVDIVYIATINTLHYEPAKMMLKAGKNVLLEKPMTMHLEQAKDLAALAKQHQRLLLSNYWSRFFPVMKYVRSVLASGRLGPISAMHGDFGFPNPPNKDDRYLNRQSGGGAMLDLGCYLVNLAVMVQSTVDLPSQIKASAQNTYLGERYKVDTEIAFHLNWDEDAPNSSRTTPMIMSGQVSFRRPSSFEVEIDGQNGRLVIHSPANAASVATIFQHEPFGSLKQVEEVRSKLPTFDDRFGPENYPRGEGFVYIINEIDQCMLEHGIPGEDGTIRPGCTDLEELSLEEQLLTVQITETVMLKAGYWDW